MELAKVCAEQDQLQMALEHVNKVSGRRAYYHRTSTI